MPVDQVTYLDPHDFNQAVVPIDENQRLFDLGKPQLPGSDGYGVTAWKGVSLVDVYYQTRGQGFTSAIDSAIQTVDRYLALTTRYSKVAACPAAVPTPR